MQKLGMRMNVVWECCAERFPSFSDKVFKEAGILWRSIRLPILFDMAAGWFKKSDEKTPPDLLRKIKELEAEIKDRY